MGVNRDCQRFNKWIRGCKFEARYSKGEAKLPQEFEGTVYGMLELAKLRRPETYIGDVCIHCGEWSEPDPKMAKVQDA